MTDISKLKAEAEKARQNLIDALGVKINPSRIADNIIAATIAQIALQTAEKEAEAHKYEQPKPYDDRKMIEATLAYYGGNPMVWKRQESTDPAPIADDGWIKWEGGECPVHSSAIVEIKCSCGRLEIGKPDEMHWNAPRDNDHIIIAYRIVTPVADRIEE